MTPKRTDAKPGLFGVSLVQVTNLNNFLARCFRTRLEWALGMFPLSLRELKKRQGATEPKICNREWDSRLAWSFLRFKSIDRIKNLMSAVGYNIWDLLRAFACLMFFILRWCRNTVEDQSWRSEYRSWDLRRSLPPTQIRLAWRLPNENSVGKGMQGRLKYWILIRYVVFIFDFLNIFNICVVKTM